MCECIKHRESYLNLNALYLLAKKTFVWVIFDEKCNQRCNHTLKDYQSTQMHDFDQ